MYKYVCVYTHIIYITHAYMHTHHTYVHTHAYIYIQIKKWKQSLENELALV